MFLIKRVYPGIHVGCQQLTNLGSSNLLISIVTLTSEFSNAEILKGLISVFLKPPLIANETKGEADADKVMKPISDDLLKFVSGDRREDSRVPVLSLVRLNRLEGFLFPFSCAQAHQKVPDLPLN